jgi:DNA end-binding protein Ku
MPRAIWKGSISFGLVTIPVTLHTAEQGDEIHFRMLDKRDMAPIQYKRVNAKSQREVPWGDIVKGYEYEKGEFVIVTEADFKRANVKATQTIDLEAFVDEREISALYFERPYYLAPARKGDKAYALLRETMRKTGKVGIATVVLHTRQHVAALLVVGDCIVLEILRYQYELKTPKDLELPPRVLDKVGVSKREVEMAQKLVAGMEEPFDPSRFEDTYRRDLLAFIEKKARSGNVEAVNEPKETEARAKAVDIMTLLKQSLARKTGPAKAKARHSPAKTSASSRTRKHRVA